MSQYKVSKEVDEAEALEKKYIPSKAPYTPEVQRTMKQKELYAQIAEYRDELMKKRLSTRTIRREIARKFNFSLNDLKEAVKDAGTGNRP